MLAAAVLATDAQSLALPSGTDGGSAANLPAGDSLAGASFGDVLAGESTAEPVAAEPWHSQAPVAAKGPGEAESRPGHARKQDAAGDGGAALLTIPQPATSQAGAAAQAAPLPLAPSQRAQAQATSNDNQAPSPVPGQSQLDSGAPGTRVGVSVPRSQLVSQLPYSGPLLYSGSDHTSAPSAPIIPAIGTAASTPAAPRVATASSTDLHSLVPDDAVNAPALAIAPWAPSGTRNATASTAESMPAGLTSAQTSPAAPRPEWQTGGPVFVASPATATSIPGISGNYQTVGAARPESSNSTSSAAITAAGTAKSDSSVVTDAQVASSQSGAPSYPIATGVGRRSVNARVGSATVPEGTQFPTDAGSWLGYQREVSPRSDSVVGSGMNRQANVLSTPQAAAQSQSHAEGPALNGLRGGVGAAQAQQVRQSGGSMESTIPPVGSGSVDLATQARSVPTGVTGPETRWDTGIEVVAAQSPASQDPAVAADGAIGPLSGMPGSGSSISSQAQPRMYAPAHVQWRTGSAGTVAPAGSRTASAAAGAAPQASPSSSSNVSSANMAAQAEAPHATPEGAALVATALVPDAPLGADRQTRSGTTAPEQRSEVAEAFGGNTYHGPQLSHSVDQRLSTSTDPKAGSQTSGIGHEPGMPMAPSEPKLDVVAPSGASPSEAASARSRTASAERSGEPARPEHAASLASTSGRVPAPRSGSQVTSARAAESPSAQTLQAPGATAQELRPDDTGVPDAPATLSAATPQTATPQAAAPLNVLEQPLRADRTARATHDAGNRSTPAVATSSGPLAAASSDTASIPTTTAATRLADFSAPPASSPALDSTIVADVGAASDSAAGPAVLAGSTIAPDSRPRAKVTPAGAHVSGTARSQRLDGTSAGGDAIVRPASGLMAPGAESGDAGQEGYSQPGSSGADASRAQHAESVAGPRSSETTAPGPSAAQLPPTLPGSASVPGNTTAAASSATPSSASGNREARGPVFDRQTLAPIVQGVLVRHAALRVTASSSSFRVVLQPKELGQVVVQVQRGQDGLQVSIAPQHAATSTLLHAHLPELLASLNASNVGPVQARIDSPAGPGTSGLVRPETVALGQRADTAMPVGSTPAQPQPGTAPLPSQMSNGLSAGAGGGQHARQQHPGGQDGARSPSAADQGESASAMAGRRPRGTVLGRAAWRGNTSAGVDVHV